MTTIAVIGLSGTLGVPLLKVLETTYASKVKFPIKAITRKQKHPNSDTVKYIEANITDTEKLVAELKGIDVIVELSPSTPAHFVEVEKFVIGARPKLFIPSNFGTDIDDPGFLTGKFDHSNRVRDAGIRVIDIATGLFANPGDWSYEIVGHYGIDPEKKTYHVIGTTSQRFSISTYPDVANTVAVIITDSDFSKYPNLIRIHSEIVTVQDVLDKYERTHHVKLTHEGTRSVEDAVKEFKEITTKNGFEPEKVFFYLQVVVAQGYGFLFEKNDRELVNPGEKLWKWQKFTEID